MDVGGCIDKRQPAGKGRRNQPGGPGSAGGVTSAEFLGTSPTLSAIPLAFVLPIGATDTLTGPTHAPTVNVRFKTDTAERTVEILTEVTVRT
jgi:hypothetical protein